MSPYKHDVLAQTNLDLAHRLLHAALPHLVGRDETAAAGLRTALGLVLDARQRAEARVDFAEDPTVSAAEQIRRQT